MNRGGLFKTIDEFLLIGSEGCGMVMNGQVAFIFPDFIDYKAILIDFLTNVHPNGIMA